MYRLLLGCCFAECNWLWSNKGLCLQVAKAIQGFGEVLSKDPRTRLLASLKKADRLNAEGDLHGIACAARAGEMPFIREFLNAVGKAVAGPGSYAEGYRYFPTPKRMHAFNTVAMPTYVTRCGNMIKQLY